MEEALASTVRASSIKRAKRHPSRDSSPAWIHRAPACVPVDQPPEGKHWIHEIKHDEYRSQLVIEEGTARVYTRNGYDWSDRYPGIVRAASNLRCRSAIIDGEAIVQDRNGEVASPARRPRCCYQKLLQCGPSTTEATRMKCVLAIGGATLLLVACSPSDACRSHKDEASCTADSACQWKAEKNRCRPTKDGKKKEQTTTPTPSEQAAPPTERAPSVAPDGNYSSPSTATQPQPVYPGGEP